MERRHVKRETTFWADGRDSGSNSLLESEAMTVGVSLGLPLFLYLRERALESVGGAVATATVAKTR